MCVCVVVVVVVAVGVGGKSTSLTGRGGCVAEFCKAGRMG